VSQPNREQLALISQLLEAGDLHRVVDAVIPLREGHVAYTGEMPGRLGDGKLVVVAR